jgi:Domain of unknown function (DUF5054)
MRRRKFLEMALAGGGAWCVRGPWAHPLQQAAMADAADVKKVLVVFKCHFDAGFIDTQAKVVRKYFDEYYPLAIETAEKLSKSTDLRYVWTTGSWLLYEYLEQANAEQRQRMEQSIRSGFIAWHAIPFSWQTEMMDPTLISGAMALSESLDRRFGRKTTGAKLTDVPGHTRGIVTPLATHGVTFLDIGVNEASRPALAPPLFRWKDALGNSIVVMFHLGYGGVQVVPGSDVAVAMVVKDDDLGPHTVEEITETYADLKKKFPRAEIVPTDLSTVANAVSPHAGNLPVVTQEIGDTWIHGVGSDPLKVARYRELCRLRQAWILEGKFKAGDATDVALLRNLLLEVEHTWGTDTKTWLDFDHYTPRDLSAMLGTKNYQVVAGSWKEKRQDLYSGIDSLPGELKQQAMKAMGALDVRRPLVPATAFHTETELEAAHFVMKLNSSTGAIEKLKRKDTGREWALANHPLATFSYQTLSQKDYDTFFKNYVISTEDWAFKDFGKPNINKFGAESRVWKASLMECGVEENAREHRLLTRLEIRDAEALAAGRAAFPREIFVEYVLPKSRPVIKIHVLWFGKPATRMPEAIWLSFDPVTAKTGGWSMKKSGQDVLAEDVVECGSRHMHAVTDGVSYRDADSAVKFVTLDAPLVAIGKMSPLNFSQEPASFECGVHFNLFNNAWGTNYIMWYGEDAGFRFVVE